MIYEMQCNRCYIKIDVVCSLSEHAINVEQGKECENCGGWMTQTFTPPILVFGRDAFPKGMWEHATDEPIFIRDEVHLKDVCEENGNISKYLEDDM